MQTLYDKMLNPSKRKVNFQDLVDDIANGYISINMIQIALCAGISRWPCLPEKVKDLICGRGENYSGYIRRAFGGIKEAIGSIELAYRRGNSTKEDDLLIEEIQKRIGTILFREDI